MPCQEPTCPAPLDDAGHSAIEYAGFAAVVAIILSVLIESGLGAAIVDGIVAAILRAAGS